MSTNAQKEKEKDAIVKKFNNLVRRLLKCVDNVIDDPELERLRMAANQAITVNDLFAVSRVGPYFFRYKEQIFAGNIEYFLNDDLGEDTHEVDDIISKVRMAWYKCNDDERTVLYDIIHELTTLYIEYVLLEKS